jgi:hypothetical protein
MCIYTTLKKDCIMCRTPLVTADVKDFCVNADAAAETCDSGIVKKANDSTGECLTCRKVREDKEREAVLALQLLRQSG